MSMPRESLKAMGLTEDQISSIITMHTETVDGLKSKLKAAEEKQKAAEEKQKAAEEKAGKLDEVQKELDALKAAPNDWEAKYKQEHSDFEAYKKGAAEKEAQAAKEKAAKAFFEGKNITGANLAIAMRGARDEINGLVLDGDKIKDTAALDALIAGEYAGLVVDKSAQGANSANPPANGGTMGSRAAQLQHDFNIARYGASKKE